MQTTTSHRPPPTTTPDLIATGKRRGGLAAKLATELEAVRIQLADAIERSGPEYIADTDLQLAAWLASVSARHPALEEPTEPMGWPAAARAELEGLIAKCYEVDLVPSNHRARAEELQIHSQIHAVCERNGGGPDLADAIILDDDRAWRQRYTPWAVQ